MIDSIVSESIVDSSSPIGNSVSDSSINHDGNDGTTGERLGPSPRHRPLSRTGDARDGCGTSGIASIGYREALPGAGILDWFLYDTDTESRDANKVNRDTSSVNYTGIIPMLELRGGGHTDDEDDERHTEEVLTQGVMQGSRPVVAGEGIVRRMIRHFEDLRSEGGTRDTASGSADTRPSDTEVASFATTSNGSTTT